MQARADTAGRHTVRGTELVLTQSLERRGFPEVWRGARRLLAERQTRYGRDGTIV
jgi:hypothetical protein